jgi:methyl-galactoside transport system substrate-binding protein
MVRTNNSQTYLSKLTGDNAKKPLVWFNRQPSDPDTGALDNTALTFNDYTCYVGFDAAGGGTTQGKMIADYIKANIDGLDKNGDGTIGYVLCIGDSGHNDSIARTRGIRTALGTIKDNSAAATEKQEGSITAGGKTYKVVELEAQEMKNGTSTWDAATAGDVTATWYAKDGKKIDLCISNNDGMGMAAYNRWAGEAGVPTFGYDANSDAVAAIK